MTLLFMIFFGRLSASEMNWYGNENFRNRLKAREKKFVPVTLLIDLFVMFYCSIL